MSELNKPKLKETTKLMPHQQRVLDKLRASRGVIVAHQLGGGKTLTSIAAGADSGRPMEVIVPAPLQENYAKEIKKHIDGPLDARIRSYAKVRREGKKVHDTEDHGMHIDPSRLLVMDEAHRLRNTGTGTHTHITQHARHADQRLLLTGTPIYNKVSDLAPLTNIAAGKILLPENPYEFKRQFVEEYEVKPSLYQKYIKGIAPGIKERIKNKEVIRDALAGRIDIHEGATEHFPASTEEHIHVPMSKLQRKIYDYHMGQIPRSMRNKIHSGLPPSKQESKNLNNYMMGVRQTSLSPRPYINTMTEEEELKHTPKITKAVDNLHAAHTKNPNFKGVVYSNFLGAGLEPYSRALAKKGIKHNVFTGKVSKKEKKRMIEEYNTGKTPILLVSSSGTEGLDLKGTRMMQVLDPHFNNSKIKQVIGRGIRYKSHHHLPEGERSVNVQHYYSTVPQGKISKFFGRPAPGAAEQYLKGLANNKDELGSQFKDVMREAHNLPYTEKEANDSDILISNPPSKKQRAKELELVQFQYKNRQNPKNLQKVLDDDMGKLFHDVLTQNKINIDKEEIEKIKVSITPIIKRHKKHFNIDRPDVLAKELDIPYKIDYLKSAQTPSYPSGHTAQAFYLALVLSDKYPKLKNKLFTVAKMVKSSRIDRGVHFLSDNKAGIELAYRIFNNKNNNLTKEANMEKEPISLEEKKKQLEQEHNKKLTYGLLGTGAASVSQAHGPTNIGRNIYSELWKRDGLLKSDNFDWVNIDAVHDMADHFSPETKINLGQTPNHSMDRYHIGDDVVTTMGHPDFGAASGATLAHELSHARFHKKYPKFNTIDRIGKGISAASPSLAFGLGTEKGTKQNLFGNIAQFGGLVGELPTLIDEGQANYNSHKYMKKFHPDIYNDLHRNESINAMGSYVARALPNIALPFAARGLRRHMDRKHRAKLKRLNESDARNI